MNLEVVTPKLKAMAEKLGRMYGPVQLLGLFSSNRSPLLGWDLIVAAPWLKDEQRESYKAIDDAMKEFLNPEERVQIGRFVVLTRAEDALQEFIDRFDGTPGMYHFRFETAGGAAIRKAYIVEANGFGPRKDPVPLPKRRKKKPADAVPVASR